MRAELLVVAAAIAAGCSSSVPQAPPTPLPAQPGCRSADPDALCVLVLGDSIAAGVPLSGDDRWWVRLQGDVESERADVRVIVDCWAVPGSRVDVLESAARDQPALATYDIAIVIEGVNDVGFVPPDEWRSRYGSAVLEMERRGLVVIVGTPPPSFEDGAFRTRYDATAEALREIAGTSRPLLDIAGRWHSDGATVAATYYSDLIHQGAEGQRVMAQIAGDAVLKLIDEP